MEVFTVFSSEKKYINLLVNIILSFEDTKIDSENETTVYLEFRNYESARIYLHFDTFFEEEITYNYLDNEVGFLRNVFPEKEVYMIDISYNNQILLYKLLSIFAKSMSSEKINNSSILFHDPFNGFVEN